MGWGGGATCCGEEGAERVGGEDGERGESRMGWARTQESGGNLTLLISPVSEASGGVQ